MAFLPVDPARLDGGALACLVPRFGVTNAMPIPITEKDSFTNFRIASQAISVSLAAKLNIGSIFNAAGKYNEKGFVFDAVQYVDKFADPEDDIKIIRGTRWGVGLRVLLSVEDLEGNLSLNFGMVSAAVELRKANAEYEVVGFGLGADAFGEVLGAFDKIGDFDYKTYQTITEKIVPKIQKLVTEKRADLVPQAIAVELTEAADTISDSRAAMYALHQIVEGRSRNQAWATKFFSLAIVNEVYDLVAPSSKSDERPNDDERRRARELYDV